MNLDHISSLDGLETEAIGIQEFLSITISEQPLEALERGSDLAVKIARTGKMMVDAKYHQDQARKLAIQSIATDSSLYKLSPTVLNKYVDSCCEVENFMAAWCERLHRNCEKQWEWTRTIISYAKEEMKLGSYSK